MSDTKKYETTRKNYTFDPTRLVGSLVIAGSLLVGLTVISYAIRDIKPVVETHVDFNKGSIVINERAVQFGAVTKGYEVRKKEQK